MTPSPAPEELGKGALNRMKCRCLTKDYPIIRNHLCYLTDYQRCAQDVDVLTDLPAARTHLPTSAGCSRLIEQVVFGSSFKIGGARFLICRVSRSSRHMSSMHPISSDLFRRAVRYSSLARVSQNKHAVVVMSSFATVKVAEEIGGPFSSTKKNACILKHCQKS